MHTMVPTAGKPGDSRVLVLEIRDKENSKLDGMREGSKMGRRCETSSMEILAKRPLMCVQYMMALYCYDEYTDQGNERFVQQATDIVNDTLRYLSMPRPVGEDPIGPLARCSNSASPSRLFGIYRWSRYSDFGNAQSPYLHQRFNSASSTSTRLTWMPGTVR
jgi:hypothetical protein